MPQIRRIFSLAGLLFGAWLGWELVGFASTYVRIVVTLVGSGVGWSVGRRYAERNF